MITDRVLVVCEADGFGGGVGVPVGRSGNRECGQLARGDLQRVGQGDDLGEGDGALVRFTVDADGTATGHPISKVAFMPLRTQRTPDAEVPDLDVGD